MKIVDKSMAPALQNGLSMLEMTAHSSEDGVGFAEFARALDVSNATVSRLLAVLRSRGYVSRKESGRYIPGPRMSLINSRQPLVKRLRRLLPSVLEAIRDEVSNTCLFILWNSREMQCLEKRVHQGSVPMQEVGHVDPDVTGGPWGFLFHKAMEGEELEALERRIKRDLDYKPAFARWSSFYDKYGFCYDDQEFYPPLRRLAAPVFDDSGKMIGALGIGGNSLTMGDDQVNAFGEILKRHAAKLAESL